MRILQVHNFYQHPGGEDQVVAAEYRLLTDHGHAVEQFVAHNQEIVGIAAGARAAVRSIWNQGAYRRAKAIIGEFAPDVIHVHNTLAEISPAVYYAAAALDVPVVQTLHNYRLLCSGATLFRDGAICEKCVGMPVSYYAPLHRCYRGSAAASAAVSATVALHRLGGTWRTKIQRYIAITDFAKEKFVQGGLPAAKITVKPNFVAQDPGPGNGYGEYVLFAGRFAAEKGLNVLFEAAKQLPRLAWKVAGDGPLASQVKAAAGCLDNVELLGHCSHERTMALMREAKLLIFPSLAYESLPMTLIEALACGTPVICSDTTSLRGVIAGGETGSYFETGNASALACAVSRALSDPVTLRKMRVRARSAYEISYSAGANYGKVMEIYKGMLAAREPKTASEVLPANS